MSELFLKIVNMSISAGWIVIAVVVLRFLLKNAPKWIRVLLWGIVAVRLICPFSVESALSLIPSAETVSPDIMMEQTPQIHTGISFVNNAVNPMIESSFAPEELVSINPLQIWIPIFAIIWLTGMAAMLIYTTITYWRLKRRVRTAVLLRDNIFQSEQVPSPFVLGLLRPKIYLPFHIQEQDAAPVIAHEQAHIKRLDHWWKPVGFLLLTLHWFNPLMWLGYILLCRDIELACDEKVIKDLDTEQKADYSQALLNCSVNRKMIAACPLAFGENNIKKRIRSVLNYKQPAFWIIVIAVIACIVTAVCFLTNPRTELDDELSVFIDMQIAEHYYSKDTDSHFVAVHHKVLGVDKSLRETTVYMWVLYREYSYENGEIKLESGAHIPTAITAKRTGKHGHYALVEYWEPRDGSYYAEDIKDKFPWHLHSKALDSQSYIAEQKAFCENAAKEYFSNIANVGGADEPVNVTVTPDLEKLKEKFPMYFDLGTFKGLEVYIWQMSETSYYCGVLPGVNRNYTDEELWDLHKNAATIDEMRAIIDSYGLSRNDVTIIPIQMPFSSYAYTINDEYRQMVTDMFWGKLNLSNRLFPAVSYITAAYFDIDGDGKQEQCTLYHGPTSGLFTIILVVYEEFAEYVNIYNMPSAVELSFVQTDQGIVLRAYPYTDKSTFIDYAVSVRDGNIVLTNKDGQEVEYWGRPQGVDTDNHIIVDSSGNIIYVKSTPKRIPLN